MVVYLPMPSTAKLKMPPHMMDVHNPQSTKSTTETGTTCKPKLMSALNTGMLTAMSAGKKIPITTNKIASVLTVVNCDLAENLPPKSPPSKRPINIKNQ